VRARQIVPMPFSTTETASNAQVVASGCLGRSTGSVRRKHEPHRGQGWVFGLVNRRWIIGPTRCARPVIAAPGVR
jgi:hypothetical protein